MTDTTHPHKEALAERLAREICAHEVGGFCQNIGGELGCRVGRGASPSGSLCVASRAQLALSGRMQTAAAVLSRIDADRKGEG